MKLIKSAVYEQFRCLAGACPDSCCQEWEVLVDDASAARYRTLPGPLGDTLREKLKQEDGEYYLTITDRRCPMWRTDGLCEIQAQLGHEGLCRTCRDFPRLRHDYGDFMELGLELSCPEAARLILTSPPAAPIIREEIGGAEPEYDQGIMDILLQSRSVALEILERRSIPEALALLLLYAYSVQNQLDGGEEAVVDADGDLRLAHRAAHPGNPRLLREFYANLEILTPRWAALLQSPSPAPDWATELRAMARYGIERYWLQAVSDFDLVARVKMIIAACLLVRDLGGDPVQTAQLYSKEIENSAENVDAILDAAYSSPAFTDVYLLGQLLHNPCA